MEIDEDAVRETFVHDLKELRRLGLEKFFNPRATLLAEIMILSRVMFQRMGDYEDTLSGRRRTVFGDVFMQRKSNTDDLTTRRKKLAASLDLTERSIIRIEDEVIVDFAKWLTGVYLDAPEGRPVIEEYFKYKQTSPEIGTDPDIGGVVIAQAAMIERLAESVTALSKDVQQLRKANAALARLVGVQTHQGISK